MSPLYSYHKLNVIEKKVIKILLLYNFILFIWNDEGDENWSRKEGNEIFGG